MRVGVLWIVMILCCSVVNMKENIMNAAKPQSLALSHGSRKDITTWLYGWAQQIGTEPYEETFFARKSEAQIHDVIT